LIMIILATLSIRLYFALKTPEFTGDEAYFNIRQTENILETGRPLYDDPLSYSGRKYVFSPIYHYVLAGASLMMPVHTAAKILPNIFATILIYIIFLICKEITKNWRAALIAAMAAGFTPIFFSKTTNNGGVESFVAMLLFLAYYFFIKIQDNTRYAYYFIITAALLTITHTSALILLAGLLISMGLLKMEKIKIKKAETEALLFTILFATWFYIIFYKEAFLQHGTNIVWQNVPSTIIQQYFTGTNIIEAISMIGIISFIFGLQTIYATVFGGKKREAFHITGIILIISGMLWLKVMKPDFGLMILGLFLAILFSIYSKNFLTYLEKTKVVRYKTQLIVLFILLILISAVIPSILFTNAEIKKSTTIEEMDALTWIKENTEQDSVVLATIEEGHLITAVANRKNAADSHFLLIKGTNDISEDITSIYSSPLLTTTVHLINKHNINYIYVSQRTANKYKITEDQFSDNTCFEKVYDNKIRIYRTSCMVKEFEI